MKYADNADIRKRMYLANETRLPENLLLFRDFVALRDKNARILGYAHHAELIIEKCRLAGSTEWVDALLDALQQYLLPLAEKEMDVLQLRKKEHLLGLGECFCLEKDQILPWDVDYYTCMVEEDLGINQAAISEYFPLQTTIPAILDLFANLFALDFTCLPTKEITDYVWYEDIEIWAVWEKGEEATGAFLGYLYLDLLERPGKLRAEQNLTLQSVRPKALMK